MNLEEIVRQAIEKEAKQKGNSARKTEISMSSGRTTMASPTNQLKRIFRWYKSLPINVIITALPKKVTLSAGAARRTWDPSRCGQHFTDKLGDAVMGFCVTCLVSVGGRG